MKNIYLVRHGESLSNAGSVAIRNPEIPLTERGKQQSLDVADWLIEHVKPINGVFVSKFIRTHQTATPLLEKISRDFEIIEGLEEFNYIDFERINGISVDERRAISNQYWQTASPDFIDGGENSDAESFSHLQTRQARSLETFRNLPNGNHVAFTHGLWLAMLIWRCLNLPAQSADMQRFRQFEQAIKTQNTEVFCLQLDANNMPSIRKVREI